VHKGEITKDLLRNFSVVVINDYYIKGKLIDMNEFCRQNKIGFIYTGTLGLYGFCFVDYGEKHEILDKNGEEPLNAIVVNINKDEEGLVEVHEEKRHGFEDDDWVTFSEVEGMTEVNGKLFQIKVVNPFKFKIGNTSKFSDYKM